MTTITLSKNLSRQKDLVILPRKEYEKLLSIYKKQGVQSITPTAQELKAVKRGRKEFKAGKYREI